MSLSEEILKNIIEKASTPEKNSAMWLDRKKTLTAIDEKFNQFMKELKEDIDMAQKDCATLEIIDKDEVIRIINALARKELVEVKNE